MKIFFTLIASLVVSAGSFAQDQRIISECTVEFNLNVVDPSADQAIVNSMSETTKTLYIKGSKVRTDLTSPSFSQSTIYDGKTDSTVILREIGKTKYISYLSGKMREERNSKYAGIKFTNTPETKVILGYECKKVLANLADGTTYNVYYAPSIVPSTHAYEYQFKDLPGFVLEYESQTDDGKTRITYTATKISLTPVAIAKFDIPQSGYRVLK